MNIPKDPVILLSYVNTQLRDFYSSFEDFCISKGICPEDIKDKLYSIGYEYDEKSNCFK